MRKLGSAALVLFILVGCAGVPKGYWPTLPSPVTQAPKPQKVCVRMEGKEAQKYTLKLSLYPSKLSFVCMKPNVDYELKKYIRSELSDFREVYFLGEKDKAPKGCYLVSLSWENSYRGYIKGGLGVFGRNYVIGGEIKGSLGGKKGSYDCSVAGWEVVPERDFHGPEGYMCKDSPAEVFFNKVASRLAYKMALRVRKALLEDMGYLPSPELVAADKAMEEELKDW